MIIQRQIYFLILPAFSFAMLPPLRQMNLASYEPHDSVLCAVGMFMPDGRRKLLLSEKARLNPGENDIETSRIDNLIESISPQTRVTILHRIYNLSTFRRLGTFVKSFDTENLKWYANYSLGSMYMEAGVLKLMYRYAFESLKPEESHINSASSMLQYLQEFFESQYNYRLDHLTPDIIKEWYELLGANSSEFSICARRKFVNQRSIPDTALVRLGISQWQVHIVKPRMRKIAKTGYETGTL